MIVKAFKYRLYPNNSQMEELGQQLETHRRLYNNALADRRDAWKEEGRCVTYCQQARKLALERKESSYLGRCYSQSCQATLRRLDKAFKGFFQRVKAGQKPGYPRFKSYGRFDSIEFPQLGCGWKLNTDEKSLTLFGIGTVKVEFHRPLEGELKTLVVKREVDQWYAIFSCKVAEPQVATSTLPPVGIDLGLKAFLVTSEGEEVNPPRLYEKAKKKLKRLQRALSRKRKGSHNRRKARLKVARLHRKIANQRGDFHHKVALNLVGKYGLIAHERLNVKGMGRTFLAGAVHDAGWTRFLGILERKAVEAGALTVAVDARHTSQICSKCGSMPEQKLKLRDRAYCCSFCGQKLDRDHNAARNILGRALG